MTQPHEARIRTAVELLQKSTATMANFVDALPAAKALAAPVDGWSPAQHICHVAIVNEVFASILTGNGPMYPAPGNSDYPDERWHPQAPPYLRAPEGMVPPDGIDRGAALARLRQSASTLEGAIAALAPNLAVQCVALPIGTVNLYQVSEYAGGHTLRHTEQVRRELQTGVASGRSQTACGAWAPPA